MSSYFKISPINLQPDHLFPQKPDASNDPKCKVISRLMEAIVRQYHGNDMMQEHVQETAEKYYEYLSQKDFLSLGQATQKALQFHSNGISFKICKDYFAFRICDEDMAVWEKSMSVEEDT
jgi:hypothetical protein